MTFVLDWQKKLGYSGDPFVERPVGSVADYFVDREPEREKLNLFIIKQLRFGIIQGAKGNGKSTLLAWLKAELEQHHQVRVLLFDDPKTLAGPRLFPQQLLDTQLNLLERVTKQHEKLKPEEQEQLLAKKLGAGRALILVDNANELATENQRLLQRLQQRCTGLQVILALERVLKEYEAFGEDSLGIALEELPENVLFTLIVRRIALVSPHGVYPFDEPDLKKLVASAKRSSVKLLSLCQDRAIQLSLKAGPPPQETKRPEEAKKQEETKKQESPKREESKKEERKAATKEDTKAGEKTEEKREEKKVEETSEEKREEKKEQPQEEKPKRWLTIRIIKEEEEEAIEDSATEEKPKQTGQSSAAELDAKLLEQALNNPGTPKEEPKQTKQKEPPLPVEEVLRTIPAEEKGDKAEKEEHAEKKVTRSAIIKGGRRR
jgi:hypothetical protein